MNSTFEHLQTQAIETLNLKIEAYQHIETGALHYHLDADNSENVFMVALRTLPTDSTGVAHILEHTALCGSERFPVRDPFFMMIRRSLNTFMNAFTSSDWTAYPFATQNRKDFDHLLQVYLDAVFFSRLDPLDFAQEGHRMEFEEANNTDSELVYKGVVFNEMKGAMSSITSTLWQAVSKHLQTGTTYENNSGGEPEDIPNLSHQELIAFYKKHYHPSNAIFMTFGNIPAKDHQEKFESLVLNRFEKQATLLRAEKQTRLTQPKSVEESYAYNDDPETLEQKNYFLLNWMLGDSTNLQDSLEAQLMAGVLLENSSSPLQKFLETSSLGSSPSSLCGVDTSSKEITFSCGLEGGKASDIAAFEQQVLQLFKDIAENGIDQSLVESVLHQLELGQREITGNSYPYGLSLMLSALPAALHDGDPIQMLDLDTVLNQLREDIQNPRYIPNLIQKYLIDNTHRVRLLAKPDMNLQEQKNQREKARLAETKKHLSDAEKQSIIDLSSALAERQEQIDDPDILPKLALTDIPESTEFPEFKALNSRTYFYPKATNGLVYQDIRFQLPKLELEQLSLLPLLTSCLTELGASDSNYLDVQQKQSASTGGISAFSQFRINAFGKLQAYWGVSSKALVNKHPETHALLLDTIKHVRFDEHQRIRELIQQIRSGAERSITGSGHALAMTAAASYQNELAAHQHIQSGLVSIKNIKRLDDSLNDDAQLVALCQKFEALYKKIQSAPADLLLISEQSQFTKASKQIQEGIEAIAHQAVEEFAFNELDDEMKPAKKQLWLTQTQVNFCAKAFPSVHFTHEDAPALNVLAHFLRNGFLHRVIREQGGAYGGGASQDNQLGIFKFYSYRDPRMTETLDDFDASIDWVINEEHDQNALEEAIFTVISSVDKPSSPSGDARQHHAQLLFGTSDEQKKAFRQGVLNTTLAQLKLLAQKYLKEGLDQASSAIVSSEANVKESGIDLEVQGFIVHNV